jgi:superfamily I DNA and/or RNA helicase
LEKSLFGLIYERVEKSWSEKKIAFKRHIRIIEQHRMHPVIGDFISKTFYNSAITNGTKTKDNVNTYSIFDGKNIVWLDVPITAGLEEGKPSYYRMPEVEKVVNVLKEIFLNLNDQKPKTGVISFYKKQVEIISNKIKETFPQNITGLIECNTVDSFQGKEFDIVVLTTVRSNTAQTAGESLGFIHYSRSRINVALSRAKRLLIVVGDANTFSKNDIFFDYIKYVKGAGYYA